ncbi:MAG: ATP-binding protein, partial [Firmicutes bacterium]|nr:ATP-binding protein [Bacillota bacterium]
GTIDIACDLCEDRIEVVITDYGKGIDNVEQAMQPFYTTGKKGERSGMGFTVMQAFCDKVEVNSQQGLTTVTLVKKA